ncbi:MAG: hypothetical protein Q4C61_07570 [Lachnospiraceae bacterium]|nr:hypothetical protein [Lachnospiraceae bacterium]
MSTTELLDEIQRRAVTDTEMRRRLLETRQDGEPLLAFCNVCRELGYELYPMELIAAGEEFHAQMKRSTNGGGENSPMLEGEDDFLRC